jgi:hypothetical protein
LKLPAVLLLVPPQLLLLPLCRRQVPLSLQDSLSQQQQIPQHCEAAAADRLPTLHRCLMLPPLLVLLLLVWILLLLASQPLTVRPLASAAGPWLR